MRVFPLFQNRAEAGQRLGAELLDYAGRTDVLVLALPRGGVAVGYEVARALNVRLDIFMVRKLGVPGQAEFAMGALASGGLRVLDEQVVQALGIQERYIRELTTRGLEELERRERLYRGSHPKHDVIGQVIILVDDGVATGSSMSAAIKALRMLQPARMVVAVPVAPSSVCEDLRALVDNLVCVAQPEPFESVGEWYDDFRQISDDEVRDLLELAWSHETPLVARHSPEARG